MPRPLNRVLMVDDDEDIRAIARLALELVGGLEVCLCATAEEGLDSIRSFFPDLVLLDVEMPGIDGLATLRMLREDPRTTKLPVIFLTARCAEADRYRSLGALEVLAKPFDPLTLAEQVRRIWSHSVGGDQG